MHNRSALKVAMMRQDVKPRDHRKYSEKMREQYNSPLTLLNGTLKLLYVIDGVARIIIPVKMSMIAKLKIKILEARRNNCLFLKKTKHTKKLPIIEHAANIVIHICGRIISSGNCGLGVIAILSFLLDDSVTFGLTVAMIPMGK